MEDGETVEMESHLSSAAAFVEGGIQDPCDDACSICLEEFCKSDPSTVTCCKHEFHLQCVLEWCQRSSQCPMCWQPISLKDPTSQELFEAVEKERKFRSKRPRNTAVFRHPTLGDFELRHLPGVVNDSELEERIFQHLAAAAAMGRARLARRESRQGRSGTHSRPQYLVFSEDANSIPAGPIVASSDQLQEENDLYPLNSPANASITSSAAGEVSSSYVVHAISAQSPHSQAFLFGSCGSTSNHDPARNHSSGQPSLENQDGVGPSDNQSFSETLKSRLSAVSMKYKETITKGTRGWRERLFSHNNSVADISSEIRTGVNAGVATISRILERFDMSRGQTTSEPHNLDSHQSSAPMNDRSSGSHDDSVNRNTDASTSYGPTSIIK